MKKIALNTTTIERLKKEYSDNVLADDEENQGLEKEDFELLNEGKAHSQQQRLLLYKYYCLMRNMSDIPSRSSVEGMGVQV